DDLPPPMVLVESLRCGLCTVTESKKHSLIGRVLRVNSYAVKYERLIISPQHCATGICYRRRRSSVSN
ncbi:MAG: hypothetical protein ACJAS2_001496, partial [Pseudohongiellaceae bacterium]